MAMKNKKSRTHFATRYGEFVIEATPKGLYRLSFPGNVIASLNRGEASMGRGTLFFASKLLRNYFQGKKVSFRKLKIDFSDFTPSEIRVLKALSRIPAGHVLTYGELARKAGIPSAARFVGSVMRKNRLPIILPCHRVVRSGGKIGRYSGGPGWKERLLQMEGLKFDASKRLLQPLMR